VTALGRAALGAALLGLAGCAAAPPGRRLGILGAAWSAGRPAYRPALTAHPTDGPPGEIPTLGAVLRAGAGEPPPVTDASSRFLAFEPVERLAEQADLLLDAEVDAVVALDALVWLAYRVEDRDDGPDERRERLEDGLEVLADLHADRPGPLLLGDLPPIAAPGRSGYARLAEGELEALNERIAAWAAERDGVRLFPFGSVLEVLRRRGGLPARMADVEADGLLQPDGLHPTRDGQLLLGLLVLEELAAVWPDLGRPVASLDALRARLQDPPGDAAD